MVGFPGQIADRAGYDRHPVTFLGEITGKLVMAGSAGFIEGNECLVDQ